MSGKAVMSENIIEFLAPDSCGCSIWLTMIVNLPHGPIQVHCSLNHSFVATRSCEPSAWLMSTSRDRSSVMSLILQIAVRSASLKFKSPHALPHLPQLDVVSNQVAFCAFFGSLLGHPDWPILPSCSLGRQAHQSQSPYLD